MAVGPWQIVIIALVILVLFGGSRLGDIGKGLGEGIKNFKKGLADDDDKAPKRIETTKTSEKPDDTRVSTTDDSKSS